MSNTNTKSSSTAVAVAISAAAIALFCTKVFVQATYPNLKLDDAATIALLVFAVAPWLAQLFELIKFGDLELKFRKIEANQQNQEIALAQLFRGMVGDEGLALLTSLRDNKPFPYKYNADTKQEYRMMLRQLRLLGFIKVKGGGQVSHIIDDKRSDVNLTEEITLTKLGIDYLSSPIAYSFPTITTDLNG